MIVEQRTVWCDNEGVRVAAEEWTPATQDRGVPIVFVPGGTGTAYSATDLGREGADGRLGGRPRAVLGISRRGTGLSDAPPSGYRPETFAGDVQAAITAAGYGRLILFGHSMGVPIALEYVLRWPQRVAGLVLGDTPAAYIDFKAAGTFEQFLKRRFTFPNWDEAFEDWAAADPSATRAVFERDRERYLVERDGAVRVLVDRDAIIQTVEQSTACAREYWPRLREIQCPVLVLKGVGGWSPLSEKDLMRYSAALPEAIVAHIPGGHDLGLRADRNPLYAALARFVAPIDRAAR